MTPSQYIKLSEERMKSLSCKSEVQKARSEALGLREKFKSNPTIRTIRENIEKKAPDYEKTILHFSNQYKDANINYETPNFNNWLKKMTSYKKTVCVDNQLDEKQLEAIILKVLRKSAPWKATGEDGIPIAIYKILPTAKKILVSYITKTIRGETNVLEEDVRARMILIYKKDDISEPANYRPIAVLNSDYKPLSATLAEIIQGSLAEWMIPKQQLARKDVWGTVHGLLWDKGCSQAARLSKSKNYSAWYDFSKAYDSVSHTQLIRLVNVLPVHRTIINTIKAAIKKWAVIIEIGSKKTNPIYIRRGIYQGIYP